MDVRPGVESLPDRQVRILLDLPLEILHGVERDPEEGFHRVLLKLGAQFLKKARVIFHVRPPKFPKVSCLFPRQREHPRFTTC